MGAKVVISFLKYIFFTKEIFKSIHKILINNILKTFILFFS
ncbi:hypothetical protein HMPREF9074_07346 [Capnocytophaga sp. oral taxon 329 str. F0087]|nr:hypothetical protein HMPREF9074_07346 [Capnocytophaga sp. oral taxon 329 str. F0087]